MLRSPNGSDLAARKIFSAVFRSLNSLNPGLPNLVHALTFRYRDHAVVLDPSRGGISRKCLGVGRCLPDRLSSLLVVLTPYDQHLLCVGTIDVRSRRIIDRINNKSGHGTIAVRWTVWMT